MHFFPACYSILYYLPKPHKNKRFQNFFVFILKKMFTFALRLVSLIKRYGWLLNIKASELGSSGAFDFYRNQDGK